MSISPVQQRLRDAIYPRWGEAQAAIKDGASFNAITDSESDESEFSEWIEDYINLYYIPLDWIKEANVNVNSVNGPLRGMSPLVMAMMARHFRLFAELIEHGADVNQICWIEEGPMTALDYVEIEYSTTIHDGESLVLDGMKALLRANGAKYYHELKPEAGMPSKGK